MTMLFMDSAGHYAASQALRKWDSGTVSSLAVNSTNTRHGNALVFASSNADVGKTISAQTDIVVGFAMRPEVNGSNIACVLSLQNAAGSQITVVYGAANTLQVFRGDALGTLLGTASAGTPINAWSYIEVKVHCSSTVGTVDIHQNGVSILSLATVNTNPNGTANYNLVHINGDSRGSHWGTWRCQDIYVLNTAGSVNNTFLGDVYVESLFPNAAGHNSGWTIGGTGPAATRWQSVNDATPDDNVTYITSSLATDTCDFLLTTPTLTPTAILSLQWAVCAEKTNAGPSSIDAEAFTGGFDQLLGTISLSNSYIYGLVISEKNPAFVTAWTNTDLATASFGATLDF